MTVINERREAIREFIHQKGEVLLSDLERRYPNVSSMTLRRDLYALEEEKYIKRVRSGAIAVNQVSGGEDLFGLRMRENVDAKMVIARKAATLLEPGRALYIDSGTTNLMLARLMTDEPYNVLTSGPNIAMEVLKHAKPSITLLGGQVSRNNVSASGHAALAQLDDLNVDTAFIGTSGFSLGSGFTNAHQGECDLKRKVMGKARRVVMLMDICKLERQMPFTFAKLEAIDILVSDVTLPEDVLEAAAAAGVCVM